MKLLTAGGVKLSKPAKHIKKSLKYTQISNRNKENILFMLTEGDLVGSNKTRGRQMEVAMELISDPGGRT